MYKDILTQKKFPETALQRFSENCSKFTGEHPRRSVISINMQINFIEIALWHGYSPVNLLHIFRIPFPKNTSGGLLWKLLATRKTMKWTIKVANNMIKEAIS